MGENLTARLVGGTGGTITKVTDIVMLTDGWHGGEGVWTQIVEVEEASAFSKIDLQPTQKQLTKLQRTALTVENDEGVFTVYAYGDKPTSKLTMQATITEVIRV